MTNPEPTGTGKVNKNTVPKVCHPQCDTAYAEAEKIGAPAQLCAANSAFRTAFNRCRDCTFKNGADQSMVSRFYIQPVYGHLLEYCGDMEASTPSTRPTRAPSSPPYTTITLTMSTRRSSLPTSAMIPTTRTGERTVTVIIQPTQGIWTDTSSSSEATTPTSPTTPSLDSGLPESSSVLDSAVSSPNNRSLFLVLVTIIPTLTIIILAACLAYFFRRRKLSKRTSSEGDCQVGEKAELHSSTIKGYNPPARELNGRSPSPKELDQNELPLEVDAAEVRNSSATQAEQEVNELASDFWESPIIPEEYL
ncbi:hypothetical protein QBC44DRAFT_370633 [Cladorrhinum sp. PSN332]|nr:hypothetical protein QBC44DRAFT_370633 [Cladorrhinum sp. PSN332]